MTSRRFIGSLNSQVILNYPLKYGLKRSNGDFGGKIAHFSSEVASADLTLYGFRFSQPTRSVLCLLEANQIPFQFETVDAIKGENRKPEFAREFPLGLVPAIKDKDFKLSETAAILAYLCNNSNYGIAESWYPTDPKVRATVDAWCHWHHAHSRMSTKLILLPKLFPKMPGQEQKFKEGEKITRRALKLLDKQLEQSTYLCGDQMTIADLLIVVEFDQHRKEVTGLIDFNPYPQVQRWMTSFDDHKWYQGVFDKMVSMKSAYKL